MTDQIAAAAGTNYARIRDVIRFDIVAGTLPPGRRLKISELAERYGVSSIPIREALQQLQGEGLVIMSPNRGATVRTVDERFLTDIYDVREVLDAFVARQFLEVAPAGALDELEEAQRALEAADVDDPVSRQAADRRFHWVTITTVHNQEISSILERQNNLINALRLKYGQSPARIAAVNQEHRVLLEALRRRDVEQVGRIAAQHARHARIDLVDRMRRSGRNGQFLARD